MVKAKLIVLLLMVAAVATAQEKVNHLVYKHSGTRITKKGSETWQTGSTQIDITSNEVIERNTSEDGKTSQSSTIRIYDKSNDVLIKDYFVINAYFIEKADSIMPAVKELVYLNKEETVNGYKCKVYTTDPSSTTKIWITQDISTDESMKEEIYCAVFNERFTLKGVIVKTYYEVDYGKAKAIYNTELSKAENKKTEAVFEKPWLRKGAEAILPGYNKKRDPNGNIIMTFTPVTAETDIDVLSERLRKLLFLVTGIEKPKTRRLELQY